MLHFIVIKFFKKTLNILLNTSLILIFTSCISSNKFESHTINSLSNSHLLARIETCLEGSTREGFTSPTTTGVFSCPKGIQTCTSGNWQGPDLYQNCDNFTKSCDHYPHGSIVNGFLHATATKDSPCVPTFKSCNDGNWIGPLIMFPSCHEL